MDMDLSRRGIRSSFGASPEKLLIVDEEKW